MRYIAASASILLVAFLVALGVPTSVSAQGAPVLIAIPESFPNVDARVLLVREPGREIVILNPDHATVEELGTALSLLTRLRRERGPATGGQLIPIVGFAGELGISRERRAHLDGAIAELRRRPLVNVGTLGPGRWMPLDAR